MAIQDYFILAAGDVQFLCELITISSIIGEEEGGKQ